MRALLFAPCVFAACLECAVQDQLFDWVRQIGGHVSPKIELSAGHDAQWTVRGLFATEDIAYDEVLASIPRAAMICAEPGDKADCRLVTKLRDEIDKGKASLYAPYLAVLEFQDPVVWSYREQDLLADFPLNFNEFNETYQDWCGFDLSHQRTFESAALTWSRQYWLNGHCMIPVLDLLNHGGLMKNVEWHEVGDMYYMRASLAINKGEQLFLKYEGPTPDLFRTFGFLEHLPRQWFFQGSNNKRQFFSIDTSENVALKARGSSSLAQFAQLIREHLTNIESRTSIFESSAASYQGSPGILASIRTYREGYLQALRLALAASENREL